jgi:hypothetical protein
MVPAMYLLKLRALGMQGQQRSAQGSFLFARAPPVCDADCFRCGLYGRSA